MTIGNSLRQGVSYRTQFIVLCCLVTGIFIAGLQQTFAGWQLLWGDDFSGDVINTANWTFDTGNGNNGWGNRELEFYTSRLENVYVADGMLHIVARKEMYHGKYYTSAKLKTHGLFSHKYGRFEFFARLPQGQGYWPALWLMPEGAVYGRWAASGEIDVMENKGGDPGKIFGTIHYGGMFPHNTYSHGPHFDFPPTDSAQNFHLYAVEWTTNSISWSVDKYVYETQTNWWSSSRAGDRNPYPAPFDQPFYIIMNLAVGGQFGGNPDDTTVFPGEMQVKYVRVYGEIANSSPSIAGSKMPLNNLSAEAIMPAVTNGADGGFR
jgi:beta-glucanase (GH16 family)